MDTAITHILTHRALGALAPSPTAVQVNPKAIKRQSDVEFKDKANATRSKKRKS